MSTYSLSSKYLLSLFVTQLREIWRFTSRLGIIPLRLQIYEEKRSLLYHLQKSRRQQRGKNKLNYDLWRCCIERHISFSLTYEYQIFTYRSSEVNRTKKMPQTKRPSCFLFCVPKTRHFKYLQEVSLTSTRQLSTTRAQISFVGVGFVQRHGVGVGGWIQHLCISNVSVFVFVAFFPSSRIASLYRQNLSK